MSRQAKHIWRVSQAKRWANDQLDQAGLKGKSWFEARRAYTAGDLSGRDWRLYDACWASDPTKMTIKQYRIDAAERYLVQRYVEDGQASDVEPGADWEPMTGRGHWHDWMDDDDDHGRHADWGPVFPE